MTVWELATGAVARTLPVPGRIGDVLFTPDGRFIVTASREKGAPLIQFLNAKTGEVGLTLNHSNSLANLAVSRDGRWLASCRGEGLVRLWALPEGRLVRTFQTREKSDVLSVAFRPDGKVLAAASVPPNTLDPATAIRRTGPPMPRRRSCGPSRTISSREISLPTTWRAGSSWKSSAIPAPTVSAASSSASKSWTFSSNPSRST